MGKVNRERVQAQGLTSALGADSGLAFVNRSPSLREQIDRAPISELQPLVHRYLEFISNADCCEERAAKPERLGENPPSEARGFSTDGGKGAPTASSEPEAKASLDNYVPKLSADDIAIARNKRRRRKRAYQRVVSGLACSGGHLRFGTLTSAPGSDLTRLGRDFSNLVKRIRRRWRFEYVAVKVPREGCGVLHFIARGSYIPQSWLSKSWNELHGAYVVDIRQVRRGTEAKVGNYVISQYVSLQPGDTRLSWSWDWVYKKFCRDWVLYKRLFRSCAVQVWGVHLKALAVSVHDFSHGKPPPPLLGINNSVLYAFKISIDPSVISLQTGFKSLSEIPRNGKFQKA